LLTTAYTLDTSGEATTVQDGLGQTRQSTHDADHDVLTSTDANGNQTTNAYQSPMAAAAAIPAHEKRLAVV
jgi:uncharacterized protein RhaS with RHS repeats